jgi:hypothetical protein
VPRRVFLEGKISVKRRKNKKLEGKNSVKRRKKEKKEKKKRKVNSAEQRPMHERPGFLAC